MNYIFVECLFFSSILTALWCVKMFTKRWKNVLFYILLSSAALLFVSYFFELVIGITKPLYLLIPYSIFITISYFVYGLVKPKSNPRKGEDIFKLESESGTIEFYYPRDNFLYWAVLVVARQLPSVSQLWNSLFSMVGRVSFMISRITTILRPRGI